MVQTSGLGEGAVRRSDFLVVQQSLRVESKQSMQRRYFFLPVLFLVTGCDPAIELETPAPVVETAFYREMRDLIHDQTERHFEQAEFFSPDPETTPDAARWMAPLIVEELDPLQVEPSRLGRFGRLDIEPDGRLILDEDQPTVYHWQQEVEIGGTTRQQSTFLWFYAASDASEFPNWRGFRTISDHRGFAIVWEILSSEAPLRVLYVSEPTEQAASREHGPPLAERRFAVEPCAIKHGDLVVARALRDGPQPLGPFVYLDYPDRHISTLICRCEPSQVGTFPASHLYQLIELEDAEPAIQRMVTRTAAADTETSISALRLPGV